MGTATSKTFQTKADFLSAVGTQPTLAEVQELVREGKVAMGNQVEGICVWVLDDEDGLLWDALFTVERYMGQPDRCRLVNED